MHHDGFRAQSQDGVVGSAAVPLGVRDELGARAVLKALHEEAGDGTRTRAAPVGPALRALVVQGAAATAHEQRQRVGCKGQRRRRLAHGGRSHAAEKLRPRRGPTAEKHVAVGQRRERLALQLKRTRSLGCARVCRAHVVEVKGRRSVEEHGQLTAQ